MQMTTALSPFREPKSRDNKWISCYSTTRNKMLSDWTVDQLHIRPYQQILEVGYGQGFGLELAARKLKVGLLAGIDESMLMYQKAYLKNKKLVQQQLLQLHLGTIQELPYPHQYFHTIYGSNIHFSWEDPAAAFIQLINMLKTGGKLVMTFQPVWASGSKEVDREADQIARAFEESGLIDVELILERCASCQLYCGNRFQRLPVVGSLPSPL
ncbi:MAG: methyltransferase domain-containing protein [Chitinophagales bacterium]